MPTTSPDNIYFADATTPQSDATISAAEATSVQVALSVRQIRQWKVANTAGLTALTGMTEGDLADQADIDRTFRYNGTVWVSTDSGYRLVTPTSVTSSGGTAVINSDATVSFTGVNSVSIMGVNSGISLHTVMNFSIVAMTVTGSLGVRGRVGGTDSSTAYSGSVGVTVNTSVTGAAAGTTALEITPSGNSHSGTVDMWNMGIASNAIMNARSFTAAVAGRGIGSASGAHSSAVAYPDITLFNIAGGTITGSVSFLNLGV